MAWDNSNGTQVSLFVACAVLWFIGLSYVCDLFILRLLRSHLIEGRVQISIKLFISWYLYLAGAGSLSLGFLHSYWNPDQLPFTGQEGDDIYSIHVISLVLCGCAAFTLIPICAAFWWSEEDTIPTFVLEAVDPTTFRTVILDPSNADTIPPSWTVTKRPALPQELKENDNTYQYAFRWVIGPDIAAKFFYPAAFLLSAGHALAIALVSDPSTREHITFSIWSILSLGTVAVCIAKAFYGPSPGGKIRNAGGSSNDMHDNNPTLPGPSCPDPTQATRIAFALCLGVTALCHLVASMILVVQFGPCWRAATGCSFPAQFPPRAAFAIILTIGVVPLAVLLFWTLSLTSRPRKVRIRSSESFPASLNTQTHSRWPLCPLHFTQPHTQRRDLEGQPFPSPTRPSPVHPPSPTGPAWVQAARGPPWVHSPLRHPHNNQTRVHRRPTLLKLGHDGRGQGGLSLPRGGLQDPRLGRFPSQTPPNPTRTHGQPPGLLAAQSRIQVSPAPDLPPQLPPLWTAPNASAQRPYTAMQEPPP